MSERTKLIEESREWLTRYDALKAGWEIMPSPAVMVRRLADALEESERERAEWANDAITAQQNETAGREGLPDV